MCQAAAAGAVDFARADPRDPNWWAGLRLRLDQLEVDHVVADLRRQHEAVVACLARDNLTDQSVTQLREAADGLRQQIRQLRFPWHGRAPGARVAELRQAWVAAWGDPADPAVQAKIAATVAALAALDRGKEDGGGK